MLRVDNKEVGVVEFTPIEGFVWTEENNARLVVAFAQAMMTLARFERRADV